MFFCKQLYRALNAALKAKPENILYKYIKENVSSSLNLLYRTRPIVMESEMGCSR